MIFLEDPIVNRLIDLMGGWLVTIAINNATLWPYLAIKDLSDFPLWMEKKIGPSVAIDISMQ